MRFRFTLSSDSLGALILDRNPKGWDDMELVISRGKETNGFFYDQIADLSFYCGAGKEYIDQVRSIEGIDANIGINIEVACGCTPGSDIPDYSIDYSDDYGSMSEGDCEWESLYQGILDMKTWKSEKNFTDVNIIESSFFQKVRNRIDTVVDLLATETIDGTALDAFDYGPYDLTLHSKAILSFGQVDLLTPYAENYLPTDTSQTLYFTFPFDIISISEAQTLNIPTAPLITGTNQVLPQIQPQFVNTTDSNIDVTVAYNFTGQFQEFSPASRSYGLTIVYTTGAVLEDPTTTTNIPIHDFGVFSPVAGVAEFIDINNTGTFTVNLDTNKALFVFFVISNYDGIPAGPILSSFAVSPTVMNLSVEYISITEDSTAKSFARFEAGARIAQVISDRTDAFRSNYLGRTNSQPYAYEENGCGSYSSLLSGFWVRGYPITGNDARTTKMSLNTFYKSSSAIDNLGLGIELIDGEYYIVIEPIEYFYDLNTTLLTFNNVPDILIQEGVEYYYSNVNVGYNKWETEFKNGLEEPNSKRFLSTGIKAVDTSKELYSDFVAGGYRIEAARRQQYSDSFTSDTEYDEDNFIVCLNRTVDGDDIPTMLDVAEKDENFDQINNLLSPETSYNLRVSPFRNYLRHSNIINPALLKYAGRNVKFMGGEGNYKMESEFTDDSCSGNYNNALLSEGQNIQWDGADNTDNSPLWIPEIATFKFPISFTDFKVVKANPKGVIMVSETSENHIPYFILDVKYIPANGGLADFKLLRAYQA